MAWTKKTSWFNPPRGVFKHSSSELVLNPELGLQFNEKKHVIKLYFAEESISQNRANYMIYLMKETLPDAYQYHVLDIRRKKFFTPTGDEKLFRISIKSEIAGIESMWEDI